MAEQAVVRPEAGGKRGIGRDPVHGRAVKASAAFNIESACHGAEIVGQEAEDALTEFLERLVAGDRRSHAELRILQPLFALARKRGFARQRRNDERQDNAEGAG